MSANVFDYWRQQDERNAVVLAAWEAAPARVRARSMLAEYRCRHRCGLLLAWQVPGPRQAVRLRPYKLSDVVNAAESTEAGRRRNTTDGDRRWKAGLVFLDEHPEDVPLPLNCDHLRTAASVVELLADINGRTPGQPVRRAFPL